MQKFIEKTLKKYLPNLKIGKQGLMPEKLPALYLEIYEFERLDINERPFLVIRVKDRALGFKDFKKHGKALRARVNLPQIWYLQELHFNKVQRMIENAYNFVVEDKQIHLPSVNISIRPESTKVEIEKMELVGMSVNMLIREILRGDISGKNKVELAKLFEITSMAAVRAIRPLLAKGLCTEKKVGVSKYVQFLERFELWTYLKENIKTPVQEFIFTDKTFSEMPLSGLSALSKRSMLTDDEIQTLAFEKKAFKKGLVKIESVLEEFAGSKVELWDRMPILVEDNCINVIDIYLVNKEKTEERVQIELAGLLKKYDLEIG